MKSCSCAVLDAIAVPLFWLTSPRFIARMVGFDTDDLTDHLWHGGPHDRRVQVRRSLHASHAH